MLFTLACIHRDYLHDDAAAARYLTELIQSERGEHLPTSDRFIMWLLDLGELKSRLQQSAQARFAFEEALTCMKKNKI